ncbi:unnamed protein product [marine sediment metagenome]|uniref:Uncharacterized protein n=1 Tax=marine sediment metagenome TaxID=412755 RepID=X1NEJ7_9ZZZZ
MDIRNWGLSRIMQLPDWCFGRRWLIDVSAEETTEVRAYAISRESLPDVAVIWELRMEDIVGDGNVTFVQLKLGNRIPVSAAAFNALEDMFKNIGIFAAGVYVIRLGANTPYQVSTMRQPINAQGRKMVLNILGTGAKTKQVRVSLVISSIPTEVPDWLVSGQGNAL